MLQPESQTLGRIPSLDGLRAISIILVLMGHLGGTRDYPSSLMFMEQYSNLGVRIFFVISGYLITALLLKEQLSTGTIDLKQFYIRRVFRIFPAAYVFLTITTVLWWRRGLRPLDIVTAYAYLSNYNRTRPWIQGHLWFLSVEEQFYLLWPLLLLYFFPSRRKLAIIGIVAAPIFRLGLHLLGWGGDPMYIYFPTVADALATGCLLSILQPEMNSWCARINKPWFVAVPAIIFALPFLPKASEGAYRVVGITIVNIAIALCVDNAIRARYHVLNAPSVVWLGALSYSLYLWQQPFLNRNLDAWWTRFPVNVGLALVCAFLSYRFVERPFLGMREYLFKSQNKEMVQAASLGS